ncbi:MAG: hypothetical protein ND895_06850 [Pyrinomonadaceae bacterium]|nr:hypothetical protein [Pyrinomonadaceae bacterium]
MRTATKAILATAVIAIVSALLVTSSKTSAQDGTKLAKTIHIQAQAMGTSTQLGQNAGVNLIIEEFSTSDDQKALLEAFKEKGNEGLVNALSKMHSKGRMAIIGTLGYDVNYIKKFDMPDGSTKIRMVTDRPIRFGEAWGDTRSMDYNLSGVEIILSKDEKKNSGVLLPACKLKIDKEGQLQLELLQNEWKLVNVRER